MNYRLENFQALFVVAIVFLTAATFVADLMAPLRFVGWLPYVVVVLLCMWVPNRHCDLIVAGICTILTAVGFFYSYSAPYLPPSVDLVNRSIGVVVIWLVAILCLRRKRAGWALREREAHFRAVAESAPNAFVGTDSGGRVISWNKAAQQMFQYTEEEILGQPLTLIMPERYRANCQRGIEQHQRTGVRHVIGRTVELHGQRKDGSEFPVEVSLSSWETDLGEVYHGIIRDITERKQAEEGLRSSHEQLRALAAGLQSVREEERTRIAREIHDQLGQALTALKMDLSWLAGRLAEDQKPLLEKTKSMSTLVDTAVQTVRKIATELRPGVLDDLGLAAAIEWQAREFQARTGIRCLVTSLSKHTTLDPGWSTAIFRIFQEILTNVARHANATAVNVSSKEEAGNLILEVQDNGKGIADSDTSNPKSLGLLGMRERVSVFGGEVKISGTPGKGTTVTVRIPLQQI